MRVLFIGNSYTYFNDLPDVLQRLASANGLEMATESVVEGGMTLLGHLRAGEAIERIRSGGWDVVVLQEQSTRPLDAPRLMEAAAQELAGEIERAGARTALFLTWARRDHPHDQERLDAAYYRCARDIKATVVPVGPSWQRALAERPALGLYQPDGSHPAPLGTYLAACAFYATLAGRSPEGTPVREIRAGDGDSYAPVELPGQEVAFLQRVAWEIVSATNEQGDGDVERGESDSDADVDIQVLRELPLLRGLSPSDADEVLARAHRVRIPAGERICTEGERGDTAYIMLEGEFRFQTSDGAEGSLDPWRMGVALDVETRSLLGGPYGYTVTAVTDVRALAIGSAELERLAVEMPALADLLTRNIAAG